MERRMMFGLGAAFLAAGAALLIIYRDVNTMEELYLALLVIGTIIISFVVGYVLGYVTEDGAVPGSDPRE